MSYKTPAALEMAVKAAARTSELDTNRAIASFYFHRLLCRVFSVEHSPFVLKGGLGVLARTIDARVTRDIDLLARDTSLDGAVEELKKLAALDLDDFIMFRFDKTEPIKTDDEYRSGVKVWFTPLLGSKALQPLSIDLVVDEVEGLEPEIISPVDRINVKGLPVFNYRVYRAECALADKLLAMIETHNDRPSSRVKDLVDVVIYARICQIDANVLTYQVEKESAARKVTLPRQFAIPKTWCENYEPTFKKMAQQARITNITPDLKSAEKLACKLYKPALLGSSGNAHWDPAALEWAGAEAPSGLQ